MTKNALENQLTKEYTLTFLYSRVSSSLFTVSDDLFRFRNGFKDKPWDAKPLVIWKERWMSHARDNLRALPSSPAMHNCSFNYSGSTSCSCPPKIRDSLHHSIGFHQQLSCPQPFIRSSNAAPPRLVITHDGPRTPTFIFSIHCFQLTLQMLETFDTHRDFSPIGPSTCINTPSCNWSHPWPRFTLAAELVSSLFTSFSDYLWNCSFAYLI